MLINNKDMVLSCVVTAQVHQQVIGGAYSFWNFHYGVTVSFYV